MSLLTLKNQLISQFLQLPIARKAGLISAACSFFAAVVLILAGHQGDRQLIQHSSQLFGESLVQQLARDASNPLVQGDKLSLQSILNKLVESPIVLKGAIYDVANRPIAEAGQQQKDGQTLSASITFQDSIAGYALITIDATPLQQQAQQLGWQLVLLALLLAAVSYFLSFLPARFASSILKDLQVIASSPNQQKGHRQIAYRGEDELKQLAQIIISGPAINHTKATSQAAPKNLTHSGQSLLVIKLDNLETLREQRSEQLVAKHLSVFKQQLEMICNLYEGEISIIRSDSFCIRFTANDDQDNYPFRALCCGYLMMQWARQEQMLTLRAGLSQQQHTASSNLSTLNQQLAEQGLIEQALDLALADQELIVDASTYQHASVHTRVQTRPLHEAQEQNDIMVIEQLAEPYQTLLKGQLESLKGSSKNALFPR